MCYGVPQYGGCSSNTECTCFLKSADDDSGICGFQWVICSKLVPCEPANNHCNKSDHICINHPQCRNNSVCYPIAMADEQICPSLPSTGEFVDGYDDISFAK